MNAINDFSVKANLRSKLSEAGRLPKIVYQV
jgi:hypothetical protein